MQATTTSAREKEDPSQPTGTKATGWSKQYLVDRCDGKSKYQPESKPPCFLCYVPPPVKWCPGLLEQNALCVTVGRCGIIPHDKPGIRKILFSIGLVANIIALALTIFSCFAVSLDFDMLQTASFTKGIITLQNSTNLLFVYVGLRGVGFTDAAGFTEPIVSNFGQFCTEYNLNLEGLTPPDQCGKCAEESSGLVASVILSAIFILPLLSLDIVRMYPNYDTNCQKFMGSVAAIVSGTMSLITFLKYNNQCFASFYDGVYSMQVFSNSTSPVVQDALTAVPSLEGATISVDFSWRPGTGLFCLYVATAFKFLDVIVHLVTPTPTITRDKEEQLRYEALSVEEG